MTGCASLPPDHGVNSTRELLRTRMDLDAQWPPAAVGESSAPVTLQAMPLDVETAVRIAFAHNPTIREHLARLGMGRAEIEDAQRIANPSFGYSRQKASDVAGAQITRSLSLVLTDALLLPSRKRFAAADFERLQASVADALLNLAADVEAAWWNAASAAQVAAVRAVIAEAAISSAELAQRFFDAGNINRLQLAQEQAAASEARIAAARANADALHARFELAALLGLSASDDWRIEARLASPSSPTWDHDALVTLAIEQRLDLLAARRAVALREHALRITRQWRWMGEIELGFERESEIEGGVLRGPSLHLQLPIFNQAQAAIARAQAELDDARAALDTRVLAVANDVRLAVESLQVSHAIIESYRDALLPQREAIVAQGQQEVNFMLMGVFELLLAKQTQYVAYQEYLQAVRDYWLAEVELKRAVGGRLPVTRTATGTPMLEIESILPAPANSDAGDHSMHGSGSHHQATPDPHAAHRKASEPDEADQHQPHQNQAAPLKDQQTDASGHDHGDHR
ncbi:MAG: TolC family protein [Pseudomarimonas sp.]